MTAGRLARYIGVALLFFGGVYFLVRSYEGIAAWLAIIVVTLLLATPLIGIAYRGISHRRRRKKVREMDALRHEIEAILDHQNEPDRLRALRDLDPMDIYRASIDLPDDRQRELKVLLWGMDVDLTALRMATEEPRKWRQIENLEMLGWFGSARTIPSLAELLHASDEDVRRTAAEALARIDDAKAYGALWEAMEDLSLPAARVATFLESSAYSHRMEDLRERGKTGSEMVRFWTAYLLGRSGDPQGLPALLLLARDESLNVRTNTAEALRRFMDHPAAREATLELMDDAEWPVRSHASKAVPPDGDEFGPKLLRLLRDRNWWVRQNASSALERMGEKAVPFLLHGLDSEDGFARNKAAEVLTRMGVVADFVADLSRPGEDGDRAVEVLLKIARAGGISGMAEELEAAPAAAQMRLVSAISAETDPLLRPLLEALAVKDSGHVADAASKLLLETSAT